MESTIFTVFFCIFVLFFNKFSECLKSMYVEHSTCLRSLQYNILSSMHGLQQIDVCNSEPVVSISITVLVFHSSATF